MTPPTSIEDEFARIRCDREHGAAELADAGLLLMARALCESTADGADAVLAKAAALVRRLADLRPSMAALGNWAVTYCEILRDGLADGTPVATACDRALAQSLDRKKTIEAALIAAAQPVLAPASAVVTLSYSSTVEALLCAAAPSDCRVIIAEARPLLEGRRLCARLEAAGRHVRCITDAQIGFALRDADMALIGADAVLGDLAVVNKTGSLFAALAARAAGKPCYAAADSFKINPRATVADAVLEEMNGAAVWPERPDLCDNVCFEPVPAELIELYLTEKGPLTATQMGDEVAAWRSLWHEFVPEW